MGFCLFNNVAVGAAYARSRGLARVAVVDFDVHHGNGTQWMFYEDPAVLYVSTHQFPYYPGTGAIPEIGRGPGAGFTVNIPLEAGATDADYDVVFSEVVSPVLEAFQPELLLVSAGYDAHHRDPLGGMRMSTDGFASIVARLWVVASRHCAGRLVAVTEGGYDLPALGGGLARTIEVLSAPASLPDAMQGDHARAREVVEVLRSVLQPYWPTL
jgi:acetoin utilization deacetylase AcuC-like enzyme